MDAPVCHAPWQPVLLLFLSSRVKHGMTALQQRLVVSGKLSVSASLPHGHPALDAGSKSHRHIPSLSVLIRSICVIRVPFLSSRVKHGMTALQQRLVVSGKLSVSASLPHGHPALDAGSKSHRHIPSLSVLIRSICVIRVPFLSSRVKHGMTALQQRLVVSGKLSVSASLPHGHPALDAGSKSHRHIPSLSVLIRSICVIRVPNQVPVSSTG